MGLDKIRSHGLLCKARKEFKLRWRRQKKAFDDSRNRILTGKLNCQWSLHRDSRDCSQHGLLFGDMDEGQETQRKLELCVTALVERVSGNYPECQLQHKIVQLTKALQILVGGGFTYIIIIIIICANRPIMCFAEMMTYFYHNQWSSSESVLTIHHDYV